MPPLYLSEAELISLMDKHSIGTDASIPQHIATIGERQYVKVVDANGVLVEEDIVSRDESTRASTRSNRQPSLQSRGALKIDAP